MYLMFKGVNLSNDFSSNNIQRMAKVATIGIYDVGETHNS